MFSIRKYAASDGSQVKELIDGIMHDEFPKQKNTYPLEDLDDICQSYGNIGDAFFVAVYNDDIIGTVAIKKEDERVALLRRIFLQKDYRKKKYGRRLIDEAIKFCSFVGYQEVIFKTTSNMQAAINLCLKKGFVEKARIDLGECELFKFALFLKENSPLA